MAPISNFISLEDDQRFALMKLRRNIADIIKPEHNDHYLLRWLKARQWNPEAAEKMLRDSLQWRKKWEVDTLDKWDPPEILKTYFPSGTTGFDKEGSPVIIVPFAGLDVWGLLHSVSKSDCIRTVVQHLERYMSSALEQSKKHGPNALKVIAIMDMDGFNMKQYAWRPAGEMVVSLLQIYEANYPEILKICYIINAPKVFSLAFSIVKKFMHENTISKIKIYKQDPKKWQSHLLEMIDGDQLPVHYGGTLIDESGDPRCIKLVPLGGKVPKEYHIRNISHRKDSAFKRITVKKGDKHNVDLICAQPGCFFKWELGVDNHDIKFHIKRKDEDGKEEIVFGPKKVSGAVDTGVIEANGPATYSIIFDNSYSYMRSKKIFYDIDISVPITDMNIVNNPEDEIESTVQI